MKKGIKCKWNAPERFIKTLNIAASETCVLHRCIGTGSKKTEQLGYPVYTSVTVLNSNLSPTSGTSARL